MEEEIPASVADEDKERSWIARNAEEKAQAFANTCARLKWQIAMFSERVGEEDITIGCHNMVAKHLLLHADVLSEMFPDDIDKTTLDRFARDVAAEKEHSNQKRAAFEKVQAKRTDIMEKLDAGITVADDEYEQMDKLDKEYENLSLLIEQQTATLHCKFKHIMAILKVCVDGWSPSLDNNDAKGPPSLVEEREAWWKAGICESPDDPKCGIIQWQEEVGRFIAMGALHNELRFTAPLPEYDWEGRLQISMSLLNFVRMYVLYNDISMYFDILDMYMIDRDAKSK
jgi:hypothetical protein